MKKWISLISMFASLSMCAQTDPGSLGPSRIIPPNPEAARLASYGQYFVSPNTGKPAIQVPIYTIKTPRLTLPINLNYEATGVKVDQLASWVGTGWVLNAGGMITRVVVGLPDEYGTGFLNQTAYTAPPNDPNYYANVCYYHMTETEPDKYFFNFNGKSGEFSFDLNKNVFQESASGLKIEYLGSGFRITDEQGNKYEFTSAEYSHVTIDDSPADFLPYSVSCWWLTKITSADGQDEIDFTYEGDSQEIEYKSTYAAVYGPVYTMEAYDEDGDQTAVKSDGSILSQNTAVMMREWSPVRLRSIAFRNGRLDFNRVADRLDGGSSRLASIDIYSSLNGTDTKQRSVQLLTDYFHYSGSYDNSQIYYSGTNGRYRLKLTDVQNLDGQGNPVGKYSFTYNEAMELPFRGSLQQDYWGYFNAAEMNDENHTTLPIQSTDDLKYTIGGADRNPNEAAMQTGVLTKIVYPTGGYTQFDWEAHRYIDNVTNVVTYSQGASAIGVNVPYNTNTITVGNYDDKATINVNIRADGWPNAPAYDNPDWVDSAEEVRPWVNLIENATGKSIFSFRLVNLPGEFQQDFPLTLNPGTYTLIVENFINIANDMTVATLNWHGTSTNPAVKLAGGLRIADIQNFNYDNTLAFKETYKYGAGETGYGDLLTSPRLMNILSYNKQFDYWYSDPLGLSCSTASAVRKLYKAEPTPSLALAGGSSVDYPVVTKYYGDGQNNAGKTIYHFADYPEVGVTPLVPYITDGEYLVLNWPWRTPIIQEQEDYAKTSTGYTLVRDTHNNYTELDLGTVPLYRLGYYNENVQLSCFVPNMSIDHYYVNSYTVNKGTLQLSSSTVKEYDPSGTLSMETDKTYTYDDQYNYFLAGQSFTNSRNEVLKTVNRYPFNKDQISNLSANSSAAIDQLVAKNILSPVIETQTWRDANLVTGRRTDYRIWDGAQNIIQPEDIQLQTGTGPLEPRQSFTDYDAKGNLLQQAKTGDAWTSYVWDYSGALPIAEVKNATDQDIAYTSFEADGNGGWTIPSATRALGSVTGKQAYSLLNGAISRTGLDPSKTYVVSYWSYAGSAYNVSGSTSVKQGRTAPGNWTYFEHTVSGVSSVTISGGASIDELRLYPAGAQMTTYTYDPLNGMTSQCDLNNRITYYEYDAIGRLMDLKDQDGNVIKTYDYHYYHNQ